MPDPESEKNSENTTFKASFDFPNSKPTLKQKQTNVHDTTLKKDVPTSTGTKKGLKKQ